MKLEPPSPKDLHSVAEEGVIALDSSDVSEFPGIVDRPPIETKTWRSPDRGTHLVFIVRNTPRELIGRTLTKFADAGATGHPPNGGLWSGSG